MRLNDNPTIAFPATGERFDATPARLGASPQTFRPTGDLGQPFAENQWPQAPVAIHDAMCRNLRTPNHER